MSPDHLSGHFGQLASSRLSQDNLGTEMGFELQLLNGFRFGTTFARSEGRQYLVDELGRDTIRGNTLGLYGTWVSPKGFYLDASWRTMHFEANLDSIAGRHRSDGTGTTTNIEAGYLLNLSNGVDVEPRLQFTSTSIDGLSIEGDQATFASREAQWKRARVGVSVRKTYGGGAGWLWTPYGEVSALRTFHGVASYAINEDYFGEVMTEGTSALVKFGVGAQNGRLSFNGGLNWLGGGALDGALGGQLALRYAW
jgi:outer membrane autotransporter protein